jgi:glycolate oxidase iron-sulfur subunit
MPGDAPVVVDSAGCGAAMKDYHDLLGTPEARRFSDRVLDVHEWLAGRIDRLPVAKRRLDGAVAVQDPCHLRHVQRAHQHVRTVLSPYADLVELDDEGLCCGAGGAYAGLHPDMAKEIRDRKVAAIEATRAPIVASANPGCVVHLAAVGLDVRHPMDIIAWSLDGR